MNSVGSRVAFHCNENYTEIHGKQDSVCQPDRTWSYYPKCKRGTLISRKNNTSYKISIEYKSLYAVKNNCTFLSNKNFINIDLLSVKICYVNRRLTMLTIYNRMDTWQWMLMHCITISYLKIQTLFFCPCMQCMTFYIYKVVHGEDCILTLVTVSSDFSNWPCGLYNWVVVLDSNNNLF